MSKTSYAKTKGRQGENTVVKKLHATGRTQVERRRLAGVLDRGDIAGLRSVVLEVKNERTLSPHAYLKELEREQVNDNADYGFVVAFRPGKPDDPIVMMSWEQLIKILDIIGA